MGLAVGLGAWRAWQRLGRLLEEDARPRLLADLLLLAALLAVTLALAGPRWGERIEKVPATGADVVLLLDVSRSMRAQDVPPSRLDRARETAGRLLADLGPGDRAALAAFAGRGVLLTPLTSDKDALAEMLPALDDSLLSEGGSRLALGLDAARSAFARDEARPRVVVVLSDGENPQRAAPIPVQPLLDAKLRVVAAAFGSEAGAKVPDQGGFVVDADGRVVTSRRDGSALTRLAAGTDGLFLLADRWGEVDGRALAAAVRRDANRTGTGFVLRRVPVSQAAPLAALAMALLLAEAGGLGFSSWRRWDWRRWRDAWQRRASGRAALAALALGLVGADPVADTETRVHARPDDVRALVALGLAHAEAGAAADAERAFVAAALRARDAESAALAYYDLGVVALGSGRLEEARDAFFDALALRPGDVEARFNLEWTLAALAESPLIVMAPPEGGDETPPRKGKPESAGGDTPGAPGGEPDTGEGEQAADAGDETQGETGSEAGAEETQQGASEQAGEAANASPSGPAGEEDGDAASRPVAMRRLGADEAARWLEAVRDDPGRALASAARAATPPARPARPGSPTW